MITGISGQDGYYLTKLALNNGFKVIGLLRPETSKKLINKSTRLGEHFNNNDVKHSNLDLRDTSQLQDGVKNLAIYFAHLASQSSVRDSFKDKNTYESNTVVSNNLIDTIDFERYYFIFSFICNNF